MRLVRAIYVSRIGDAIGPADIEHILESARTHNHKNAITGILCFNGDYFLQCLEGSRSAVNKTYCKIVGDPRHREVTLLEYREASERNFPDWDMAFVPQSSLTSDVLLRYSAQSSFEPYELSGLSSLKLLRELAGRIKVST